MDNTAANQQKRRRNIMEKLYYYDDFIRLIISKIQVESDYFQKYISTLKKYPDGMFYEGYLWDCFRTPKKISEEELDSFLKEKSEIYVFWDNHSDYRVNIAGYFKYGKKVILKMSGLEFLRIKDTLPEDIYITDKEKSFLAAYTHEWFQSINEETLDSRYCLITR